MGRINQDAFAEDISISRFNKNLGDLIRANGTIIDKNVKITMATGKGVIDMVAYGKVTDIDIIKTEEYKIFSSITCNNVRLYAGNSMNHLPDKFSFCSYMVDKIEVIK